MSDVTRGADKFSLEGSERRGADYRPLGSGELADAWELDDFFEALGPVMRLPPRDDHTAADSPLGGRRAGVSHARGVLLAGLAIALLAGAAVGPALLRAMYPREAVPAVLYGRWRAEPGRYAGRSFEVSATTLRLNLGGPETAYPITGVRHRDSSGTPVYTIHYRDAESVLDFGVAVVSDSVARLRNLADVAWSKVSP